MDYNKYSALAMDHSGYVSSICNADVYEVLYMSKACMDLCGLADPENYRGEKCHRLFQGLDEPCSFSRIGELTREHPYCRERFNDKFGRRRILWGCAAR